MQGEEIEEGELPKVVSVQGAQSECALYTRSKNHLRRFPRLAFMSEKWRSEKEQARSLPLRCFKIFNR